MDNPFLGSTARILSVAFSPDGKILAAGCADATIRLWDVASRKRIAFLKGPSDVQALTFSPDGKTLAAGIWLQSVHFWDVASGKELGTTAAEHYDSHWGDLGIQYSPDSKILSFPRYHERMVWDVAGKKPLATFAAGACSAFSPDGKTFVSGFAHGKASTGSVSLWDVATRTKVSTFKWHEGGIRSVAFAPDGRTLASGGEDKVIKLWNVADNTLRTTLKDHPAPVVGLKYGPSGKRLLATSAELSKDTPVSFSLILWELATEKPLTTLKLRSTGAWVFAHDGKSLAMAQDGVVKLYDVADFMDWLK
jgi:WD40 repeat protein